MRLALINNTNKTITILDNRMVIAVFTLQSGDLGITKQAIEEMRVAEYKDKA